MPLGIELPNSPGSICGLSGKAFRHGVADADGGRVCHAFYMRKSLHDFTKVRPCGWMTQEVYRQWIGKDGGGSKLDLTIDLTCT